MQAVYKTLILPLFPFCLEEWIFFLMRMTNTHHHGDNTGHFFSAL